LDAVGVIGVATTAADEDDDEEEEDDVDTIGGA
jgi:hypothetical protein